MKYYEIRDMDEPECIWETGLGTRVFDEDELDRRINLIAGGWGTFDGDYNLDEAKQILLHGKVKEEADPWEEWAEGAANAICDYNGGTVEDVKDALLKLKTLVEKNTGCDSTPSKR